MSDNGIYLFFGSTLLFLLSCIKNDLHDDADNIDDYAINDCNHVNNMTRHVFDHPEYAYPLLYTQYNIKNKIYQQIFNKHTQINHAYNGKWHHNDPNILPMLKLRELTHENINNDNILFDIYKNII
jgi:hypothetical protein